MQVQAVSLRLRDDAFNGCSSPARSAVMRPSDHREHASASRSHSRRAGRPGSAGDGMRGSSTSQAAQLGSTTPQTGALAFARCMRSHGVPNYPDPTSTGLVKESPQQLGVSSSQFQSASSKCDHLLPNGGSRPSPARVQRVKALSLEFSQCVRRHGVRNFPDPASDGRIPDPATVGVNQGSPKFEAANRACGKYQASLHALECRLQRLRQDTGGMSATARAARISRSVKQVLSFGCGLLRLRCSTRVVAPHLAWP